MTAEHRILYLFIGCVIGFILGYIARMLREIRDGVEKVDEHVTHSEHVQRKDDGLVSRKFLNATAIFLVVALTAFASFRSQSSSNDVKDVQKAQDSVQIAQQHEQDCTKTYVNKTIAALNARTQFTTAQNSANYDLQKAQSKYLSLLILSKPPPNHDTALKASTDYLNALSTYLSIAAVANKTVVDNPYPTSAEYNDCLVGTIHKPAKGKKPK